MDTILRLKNLVLKIEVLQFRVQLGPLFVILEPENRSSSK